MTDAMRRFPCVTPEPRVIVLDSTEEAPELDWLDCKSFILTTPVSDTLPEPESLIIPEVLPESRPVPLSEELNQVPVSVLEPASVLVTLSEVLQSVPVP